MVSPCLLLLGVEARTAVACSIVHMAVKSIPPSAMRWRDLRREGSDAVWTAGLPMLLAALLTVGAGSWLVTWLGRGTGEAAERADLFVALGYCGVTFLVAAQCLWEHDRFRRGCSPAVRPRRAARDVAISAVTGGLSGLLQGALGVGGGLIRRPVLQHILRLAETETAGLSQMTVLLVSVAGALFHARAENILWPTAVVLSVGGLLGQTFGTAMSRRAIASGRDAWANLTFGVAVGGIFVAAVIKVFALDRPGLETVGHVWILVLGTATCLLVFWGVLRRPRSGPGPNGTRRPA